MRFAECLGISGNASVKLALPHGKVHVTDLTGHRKSTLRGADTHTIPVRPQEIITLHFETTQAVPKPEPVTQWEPFVPKQKLAALHSYDPTVKGHPPFGDNSPF